MKKFVFLSILVLGLIFINMGTLKAQQLYLYGGQNNDVFLGCLTCNKFNTESIWYKHGTYGSKHSSNSIWNKHGTYGSKHNMYSPWNQYSNNAPVVVDKDGNFYGYFSSNKYIPKRVTDRWLIEILDNWEWIMDNFDDYVGKLKL